MCYGIGKMVIMCYYIIVMGLTIMCYINYIGYVLSQFTITIKYGFLLVINKSK